MIDAHALKPVAALSRVTGMAGLLLIAACAQPEPKVAAPADVDNQALGIRLLLPADPWTLVANEAERMVLEDGAGGTMTLHLGEESEQTPNIIEAVRGRLAEFDARDGGQSFGSQQFQAPIGLVYTARGTYPDAGGTSATVGELSGYTVHASGNRFLILTYTFPGKGDPKVRYDNLLALLESLTLLGVDG